MKGALSIGIEIAPSALRAAVVECAGSSSRRSARAVSGKLLTAREVPCDTANPAALTQALTHLRQSLRLAQPAVLGLPSTCAILTTIQPLTVNNRRALLAVQFELQQLLPFQLSDAVWHHHWLSANGQTIGGSRLQAPGSRLAANQASLQPSAFSLQRAAVVAAVRRQLLDERLACCRRAGVAVRAVGLNAVASFNAWCAQGTTPLSVPSVLLNLVNAQAVEWIVHTARALAIVPVMSRTAAITPQELVASWQGLCHQDPELQQCPVTIAGAIDESQSLRDALAADVQQPIALYDLARVVALGSDPQHAQRCVAAVGLALQGSGPVRVPLNLLAASQNQEQSRTIQRAVWLTSGVGAVAAIGFGLSAMAEISHRRALVLQALERREHLYQTLRPEVRAFLQRQERVQRRSLQLEQLVTNAPAITQLFGQIADLLPDGVWLTKFECSRADAMDGLLEGRAKSFQEVTQLIDRLKSVPNMTAVKPLATTVTTDTTSGKEMIAFTIQVQRQLATAALMPQEAADTLADSSTSHPTPPRKGSTGR